MQRMICSRNGPCVLERVVARALRKAVANNRSMLADLMVLIASAVLMGLLNGREFDLGGFHNDQMLVILFFGTLSVVGALKTFGHGKVSIRDVWLV